MRQLNLFMSWASHQIQTAKSRPEGRLIERLQIAHHSQRHPRACPEDLSTSRGIGRSQMLGTSPGMTDESFSVLDSKLQPPRSGTVN
jgi:hypothetical protein